MRHNFTLIELLTVMAILALLAAILLPSLSHARECARSTSCTALLKQYACATSLYADDYNDFFPDIRRYLDNNHGFISYFSLHNSAIENITRCPADGATMALGRLGLLPSGASFIHVSIGGTVNLSDSASATSNGHASFFQSRNDICLNAAPSRRCQWTDYQNQNENKFISGAAMSISKGHGSISFTLAEYVFRHPNATANGAFCDGHVAQLRLAPECGPANNGHDIAGTWSFPGNCTWPYGPRQGPPHFPETIMQTSVSF